MSTIISYKNDEKEPHFYYYSWSYCVSTLKKLPEEVVVNFPDFLDYLHASCICTLLFIVYYCCLLLLSKLHLFIIWAWLVSKNMSLFVESSQLVLPAGGTRKCWLPTQVEITSFMTHHWLAAALLLLFLLLLLQSTLHQTATTNTAGVRID